MDEATELFELLKGEKMDETISGFDCVTTNELFELLKLRIDKAQKMFNQINHQNEFEMLSTSFSHNINEIMEEIKIRLI